MDLESKIISRELLQALYDDGKTLGTKRRTYSRTDQAQTDTSPEYLLKIGALQQGKILRQRKASALIEKRLENQGKQRNQHKYCEEQAARQNEQPVNLRLFFQQWSYQPF